MADIVAPPTDHPTEPPVLTPEPTPLDTAPADADRSQAAPVEHTPGGWPATPLALLTANTAVAGTAAAAMAASPVLALLAAGGTATLVAAGRVRRRTQGRQRGSLPRTNGLRSGGLLPRSRTPRTGNAGGTRGGAVGASGRRGQQRRQPVNPRTGAPMPTSRGARGGARGTLGQIRSLRDAHRAAHPSRSARRERQSADRQRIADGRRQAKRQARQERAANGGRGPRALLARAQARPKAMERQAKRDADRDAKRAEKGQASSEKVTAKRRELRRQPVRRAARWRLHRSAARFHARRAGNGLLALPVLLLGTLTTWAGRKLGFPSWMYPGHRLFRWLGAKALSAYRRRDTEIRCDWAEQEAAIDAAEARENSATKTAPASGPERAVERAPLSHNANTNLGVTLTTPAGFDFAEAAAEMEAQAQSFEPDGMMQVLSAFEGMPEAMHSIARTFQILAERSDAEFPLEKEVGEALNDVFRQLQQAIGACEEVATTMRRVHEQDIRRHEDPRNGEDKWDTGNN
jgi:hypothetical protein